MREILKFIGATIALIVAGVLISLGLIYILHQGFQPNLFNGQYSASASAQATPDQKLVIPPSATVRLPPGQKLVQYDYAPDSGNILFVLSYLTRDMRPGEASETYRLVRVEERYAGKYPKEEHVILLVEQAAVRAESAGPDPTRK